MLNKSSDFTFSELVEAEKEKLHLIQNKSLNLPVSVRLFK